MARINHYKTVKEIRNKLIESFKSFKANDNKKEYKDKLVIIANVLNTYINSETFDDSIK